jgi:hypothetical protein
MRRAPNGFDQSFAVMRSGAANQRTIDVEKHQRAGAANLARVNFLGSRLCAGWFQTTL